MKKLLLLFVPLVFFFSCELFEEDDSSVTEWCVEFHISSDLEATWRTIDSQCDQGSTFYFTGENTSGVIGDEISTGLCCFSESWIGKDENELHYSITLAHTDNTGCCDIESRLYKDGDLFYSESVQLGCLSEPGSYSNYGMSCDEYCGQYGNSFTFIVDIGQ